MIEPIDVIVYTDGSCPQNRRGGGPGGWAALVCVGEDPEEADLLSGNDDRTTNNRMELTAILKGLEYALEVRPLGTITVRSDSEYAIKVTTGQYRANENLDLVTTLRTIYNLHKHRISFEWVKGHDGNFHNEYVDRVAREQADAVLKT